MTSIMGQTTVELGRYLRVKLQQGMNAWGATCEKHARAKEQVINTLTTLWTYLKSGIPYMLLTMFTKVYTR